MFDLGSFPAVCYCAAHVSLTGFPLPSSQECWGVQLYVRHCFYVGSEDLNSGHQANHIRKYNFLFCIILLSTSQFKHNEHCYSRRSLNDYQMLAQQKISSDLMAFHQAERRGNTKSSVRKNKEAIYHNNHRESYHLPTKASVTNNTSEILWSIRVSGTRP